MKQRGRQSQIALMPSTGEVTIHPKPDVPYSIVDEEIADVWRAVIAAHPHDWFNGSSFPMLEAYCVHVVRSRRLGQLIAAHEEDMARAAAGQATIHGFQLEDYLKLLAAEGAQSRIVASLATKMRISPQSAILQRPKDTGTLRVPWLKGK